MFSENTYLRSTSGSLLLQGLSASQAPTDRFRLGRAWLAGFRIKHFTAWTIRISRGCLEHGASLILQREWWCDTIVLVYGLWCSRRPPTPYEIGHGAIYWCPGDVSCSLLCEWLSHQVPGPRVSIPSLAGSVCIPASADQWPILGVAPAVIREVREDTGSVKVWMINLHWLLSPPSSY